MTGHTVQDTSLLAYRRNAGRRGTMEQHVLNALQTFLEPPTALELAQAMGFRDPNHVKPRLTDLKKKGLIVEAGRRRCAVSSTGETAKTWRVVE